MDKIGQLKEKVNQNLSDYHEYIKGFGKQEIIDMAGKINAMNDAHMYLTGQHEYEEGQAEYLLGFKNPLELVADMWNDRLSDLSDMAFDVNRIFYDRDMEDEGYEIPENDYAELNKTTQHGEKATRLMARFDQNLSDIRAQMTILDRQGKSDMVSHCFAMITAHNYISDRYFFSEREAGYLLQFKNPLKIIADAWEKRGDITADVGTEIDGICHTQKSERDGYELMEADAPAKPQPVDVQAEAGRIAEAMKGLKEPNSPNKTCFAVRLSDEFMMNASTKDHNRLMEALPFKRHALTGMDGQKGIFVLVPKDELQKPSLLGKLAAATKQAAAQARQPSVDKAKKAERNER